MTGMLTAKSQLHFPDTAVFFSSPLLCFPLLLLTPHWPMIDQPSNQHRRPGRALGGGYGGMMYHRKTRLVT